MSDIPPVIPVSISGTIFDQMRMERIKTYIEEKTLVDVVYTNGTGRRETVGSAQILDLIHHPGPQDPWHITVRPAATIVLTTILLEVSSVIDVRPIVVRAPHMSGTIHGGFGSAFAVHGSGIVGSVSGQIPTQQPTGPVRLYPSPVIISTPQRQSLLAWWKDWIIERINRLAEFLHHG